MRERILTVEEGLVIQQGDLDFWKNILKPEYYEMLEQRVFKENDKLVKESNGWDVFRGCELYTVVANFRYS